MKSIVLVGKGPSLDRAPWATLDTGDPVYAINEAVAVVPPTFRAPVYCILQDIDVLRRMGDVATSLRRPTALIVPQHFGPAARSRFPAWDVETFDPPLWPKAAAPVLAMYHATDKGRAGPVLASCVGFDALFGRETAEVYAESVHGALRERQKRGPDYDLVNTQIHEWAEKLGVTLLDASAE